MLKPFKEWDNIMKVVGIATAFVTVVGFVYAMLPGHATSVVVVCLVLATFLLFYPWRFPNWSKVGSSKTDDDFYPVMKWGWCIGIVASALVGFGWFTTNLVWLKSPEALSHRMQGAFVNQSQVLTRDGMWDATLVQTNLPAPEVLVGFKPLAQAPEVRCASAVQALRAAFGELSSYSRDLRLVMIMVFFVCVAFAGVERLHEATLKTNSRRRGAVRKIRP